MFGYKNVNSHTSNSKSYDVLEVVFTILILIHSNQKIYYKIYNTIKFLV